MMCITDRTTTSHKKKYSQCYDNTRQCAPILDIGRVVVNLSRHQLTQEETTVLAKGGNVAIIPTNLPVEDIIASIEPVIRKLQPDVAEEIRRDSARILQHSKPPVCNIAKNEKSALNKLNGNKDIIISADKGNATVITDTEDYQQKIRDILNTDNYRPLPKDPTASILRKSNDLIKKSIPQEQKFLKISEALPPRLYSLPKIHKPDTPLRPIVSAIN
ncbi:Uncharacterized protein GBIM_01855 [Gryllus bimaculatus]|nr:Uncharacterized protein GBIM_01855 [Gryllus bimaculatus]